jgi:hypothetical protein
VPTETEPTEIYSLETHGQIIVSELKPYRHVMAVTLGTRHTPHTLRDKETTMSQTKDGAKEHPTQ